MATATQYGMNFYSLTLTGLDFTVTGATKVGTTDANNRFVPMWVHAELTSVSGFTSVPTISIGTNASSYNNGLGNTTLTNLNQANQTVMTQIPQLTKTAPASSDIFVNVTTAAVATTYVGRVTILGFYY